MVKITDYKQRENSEGKTFFALTLQGEVEIIRSVNGNSYATIRRCSLPTTFDEMTCKGLLGQELPGEVKKVDCEPYDYTIQETGEIVVLTHRYEYVESDLGVSQEFTKFYDHSLNGAKPEMA